MSNEKIKIEPKYITDITKSIFFKDNIIPTLSGGKRVTPGKISNQGDSSGIYEFIHQNDKDEYIIKLFKPYSENRCRFNPDHYFEIIEFAKDHTELISILEAGKITIEEEEEYGFTEKNEYIYMIMEKGTPLTPNKLNKFILRKILSKIVSLHKKGIEHNDIKLDNIVMTKDDYIKFIDFEETISTTIGKYCGTGEEAWVHCKGKNENDEGKSSIGCPNQVNDRKQFYKIYLTFINKEEEIDTVKLEEMTNDDFNNYMINLIDQTNIIDQTTELSSGKKIRKSKKNKQNKNRIKSKKLRLSKKNKSKKRKIKRSNKFKI